MVIDHHMMSTNLSPFIRRSDRFVPGGYNEETGLEEAIATAGKIPELDGLEFLFPTQFTNHKKIKELMNKTGLKTSCVQVDLFSNQKWKFGSLASFDEVVRREAIEISQRSMDISAEMGAYRILLWLGQDGYDYLFQVNYKNAWNNLIHSLKEIANYRSDVQVSIEYKMREPRTHSYISNMGTVLYAIMEVGLSNLGVVIDTGHSLLAYENLAEVATLALRRNALHAFHLNDCYRYADDDLVIGTVHTWEFVELLYWMTREKFDGWWTLDTYPYRENGIQVIEGSISMFKTFVNLVKKLDDDKLNPWQNKNDALTAIEYIRDKTFSK